MKNPKNSTKQQNLKQELQTDFSPRQYMLSEDYEVYYYSTYSPVEPHSHPYYEFYFFVEGDISMNINGKIYFIKPGSFLFIPPNVVHHVAKIDPQKPYRRFVIWISEHYYKQLCASSSCYHYLYDYATTHTCYIFPNDAITFNRIQSMIFQILEEVKGNRFGRDFQISLQIDGLLLYLNRLLYNRTHTEKQPAQSLPLAVCDYIREHLTENLSLDILAETFYVSKYYLSHCFKENIGISLHQYILKLRLEACKTALLTEQNIHSICEQYGFCDYSSFFRAFKKEYGISPKEYQKNGQNLFS